MHRWTFQSNTKEQEQSQNIKLLCILLYSRFCNSVIFKDDLYIIWRCKSVFGSFDRCVNEVWRQSLSVLISGFTTSTCCWERSTWTCLSQHSASAGTTDKLATFFFSRMQFLLPFLFCDIVRPSLLLVFFLLSFSFCLKVSRHWCQVNFAREEQEAGDTWW